MKQKTCAIAWMIFFAVLLLVCTATVRAAGLQADDYWATVAVALVPQIEANTDAIAEAFGDQTWAQDRSSEPPQDSKTRLKLIVAGFLAFLVLIAVLGATTSSWCSTTARTFSGPWRLTSWAPCSR